MDLAFFRRQMLAALHAARSRWPHSRLHLLYAPGWTDPLGLADSSEPARRDTALIPWARDAGYDRPQYPRVIELDCRRVAAYLLETDPAFDDPLLEESITLAQRDLAAGAAQLDREEGLGRCLSGWLASPDSADTIARRFAGASQRIERPSYQRYWLRWHDPRMMALLWPQMTAAQRSALLGEQLSWLAFDATGQLVEFASPSTADAAAAERLSLTPPQWAAIHQLAAVNQLVDAWRAQRSGLLPRNACEAVQSEIVRAQAWGLDGRDLQVFVLLALELRRGFEQDADLQQAVNNAARNPGTLADHIDELPAEFWQRHGPNP